MVIINKLIVKNKSIGKKAIANSRTKENINNLLTTILISK